MESRGWRRNRSGLLCIDGLIRRVVCQCAINVRRRWNGNNEIGKSNSVCCRERRANARGSVGAFFFDEEWHARDGDGSSDGNVFARANERVPQSAVHAEQEQLNITLVYAAVQTSAKHLCIVPHDEIARPKECWEIKKMVICEYMARAINDKHPAVVARFDGRLSDAYPG